MIIKSKRVYTANGFREACIRINGGRITAILPYCYANTEGSEADSDTEVCDWGEKRVLPGFIDIHTHGAYGFDTNDAEAEGLKKWARHVPEEGVTAFLPTVSADKKEVLLKAAENVASVMKSGYMGAEILGLHFEGPYLDPLHRGAQPMEACVKPDVEEFKEFQKAAEGNIRYISLAPEHDKDFELIKYCVSHGVTVAMGHSGADLETAVMAVANGVSSVTHVYNGMSPFMHRAPGLVGAALRIRELYGEIICDCMHSTPDAVNIFFNAKGAERAIMVTDSLSIKGAEDRNDLMFCGKRLTVDKKGLAHLEDGTIAGSSLRMNKGLKNLVEKCGVPIDAAINSCTINPAVCIGVGGRKGKIAYGYDADIVVLDDDYTVLQTYCKGVAETA